MRFFCLRVSRVHGVIGVAAAAAVLVAACGGSSISAPPAATPRATTQPTPATSAPAPTAASPTTARKLQIPADFRISAYQGQQALGGDNFQFSSLFNTGKPVILNFWAGLCPPCRAEMPDLQALYQRFQERIILFGLDVGPFVQLGSRDDGQKLLRELGVTYPAGTTFDANVVRTYEVLGMPTTYFMTPDGKVFRKWTGLLTQGKMIELAEGLLKAQGGPS